MREDVTSDMEQPDPLALASVLPLVLRREDSYVIMREHSVVRKAECGSSGKRSNSPTRFIESMGKANLEAPGWTKMEEDMAEERT